MQWVWSFQEGAADKKALLGGKGANLAEMTRMGLPVPPGFTITTEACREYLKTSSWPETLRDEVHDALAKLEATTGRTFGGDEQPLLLSVRSGAVVSMPGMMDTVLNLGITAQNESALAEETDDPRFAADARRRFVEMFGDVVLDVPVERFRKAKREAAREADVEDVSFLEPAGLHALTDTFLGIIEEETGSPMPTEPRDQLDRCIDAVFRSWNGKRARDYRRVEGIPDDLGTAVNVQIMVFGNTGKESGTGVAFTRDPSTGDPAPTGDFLPDAQGEDVVAGIRPTESLDQLAQHFPDADRELREILDRLEQHYREMCDIEFTIDRGHLWILQTRTGKRTALAAARIAVDMVDEGLIDRETAVRRFSPTQLERLQHPRLASDADYEVLASGVAASPGAAVGEVTFDPDEAERRAADGRAVILMRTETSPDDVHGMIASRAIVTSHGGSVSHAAIVARGMGKPAVTGVSALEIDERNMRATVGDVTIEDGDLITVDGAEGIIVLGEVEVETPEMPEEAETILGWADQFRRLGVRANADTPDDAAQARAFGAEGIGLCRTEHMFLGDRLPVVQRMILADTDEEEEAALAELHDLQLEDFVGVLEAMDGLPTTVRLLDPPLHEFLPDEVELLIAERTGELDDAGKELLHAVRYWAEANPMLGVRGVRLAVLRPGLYRMQVRALIEAAVQRVRDGGDPRPQIMIPLTIGARELAHAVQEAEEVVAEVLAESGVSLEVPIGTMVETPRAALRAGDLTQSASFLSFGTNDLTQMTFGFSRDDVEGIMMPRYLELGLLDHDPFQSIDADGVGELVATAVARARTARPDVELGVCGEHGGDPASIARFDGYGLDYVSCSPFRVAEARLAAAHAALARK